MRILVVEDDHNIGQFIREGLTEAGYAVDLVRLSNDLLFLARLEQRRLHPNVGEHDLSDLLGAIVDQMRPLATEKEIHIVEQSPPV
jgi:signal transduction histidine kinase